MGNGRAVLTGFGTGAVGWLAVGAVRLTDAALIVLSAVVIGAAVAAATRRAVALPGLLVGILVSYPAALALGMYAFLGEGWELYTLVLLALVTVGFVGVMLFEKVVKAAPRS